MIYHDLNEKNFLLFAMQHYDNPQCVEVEEFNDDLRRIKYIKRLFNQYHLEGTLKERLLLNHIIVFYNVFPVKAGWCSCSAPAEQPASLAPSNANLPRGPAAAHTLFAVWLLGAKKGPKT